MVGDFGRECRQNRTPGRTVLPRCPQNTDRRPCLQSPVYVTDISFPYLTDEQEVKRLLRCPQNADRRPCLQSGRQDSAK